jgi:hypothetical protein
MRYVKAGAGWRIGWDDTADAFQGLVSGADWALELTAAEFDDFRRLALQLAATMRDMATVLMAEERVTCEQETATLWIEAEGYPAAYGLRFILLTGRRGEGAWPAEVVPELLAALPHLRVF